MTSKENHSPKSAVSAAISKYIEFPWIRKPFGIIMFEKMFV